MTYFAPYIDETGFHMPTYIDIRDKQIDDAKNIFGQDIYLGEDSQDYQYICTVAEKIYDAFQVAQQVYNNRAPNSAIGAGLDSIVKINGIKRKAATYSKCNVTVMGTAGIEIKNGIVVDKGNIKWDLPTSVKIPDTGKIVVEAVCQIEGPIVSNPGDLTGIYNPTYGWNGVYNYENGSLGSKKEDDLKLRKRQSDSTAQPSRSILDGTSGAVAKVDGVTRSYVYENDTNLVDSLGLPPHSITVVVEGGTDEDIARAIHIHKGPGCYSNGDVRIDVTDSKGQISSIGFYRAKYVDIDVTVNIKALDNYTTAITDNIKKSIESYLNSMKIENKKLVVSSLWGVSLQAMSDLSNPTFSITSITASRHGKIQSTDDIELAFNETCRGNVNYITANVL